MRKTVFFLFVFFLFISSRSSFAGSSSLHHELSIKLDPPNHFIEVRDVITIPADRLKPVMHFFLHNNLAVTSEMEAGTIQLEKELSDSQAAGNRKYNLYKVTVPPVENSDFSLTVHYKGKIHHPIRRSAEEYARGFSETSGIIDAQGVYLCSSSYWIPWFHDDLFTFNMTVTLPETWDVVSQGERTLHEIKEEKRHVRWESPQLAEEIYLIAAQFTEYWRNVGAVTTMAFLRTPDENLANKYLDATAQYLEMYRQLIGPFPYKKFALVENFWETGYGMPSFTLLGERVIRFPFILHSSYPHELLHNWWGNGVYVNHELGNWCEGLTAYMADHLIKEQRSQGVQYRRSALQKYTDYVNKGKDFPLTEFRSRYDAATEAVGYGKSLMIWNMLRRDVGDELFVKSLQHFYRQNKFKRASFDDIRQAFEEITGKDLQQFFQQWITRTGAPELRISDVYTEVLDNAYQLDFTLFQLQPEAPYRLHVPIAVYFENETAVKKVEMTKKEETFQLKFSRRPLRIEVDPQFDLFRLLHHNEIPPSLSKAFGAERVLILLPSEADADSLGRFRQLAERWSKEKSGKFEIRFDKEIKKLPAGKAVWLFGWDNIHRNVIEQGVLDYDVSITGSSVRFGNTTIKDEDTSYVITVRHPENPDSVAILLSIGNNAAMPGLARKLPHYGKYSYLAFEGSEPSNIAKGQWPVVHSPLSVVLPGTDGLPPKKISESLPGRQALAQLRPVFSEDTLLQHVHYLASKELKGRGLGTPGIEKAAEYIAQEFKKAGLIPAGDNGTYFQNWVEEDREEKKKLPLKNIIGILPGKKKEWDDQSVVVCAHYDHLGLGWPDVYKGNKGKIHHGANDNASGVAVLIELAHLLGKEMQPDRTIVFAAFTAEEWDLRGSEYYVKNMKRFPAQKTIAALNLDTVGHLDDKKLRIIHSSSAREWKYLFMGVGYVTGIEYEIISEDIDSSDQVSFIHAGVPAVQIFSGARSDYHRPGDTIDKIDAAGMVKIASFMKEAINYLAERETPLTFTGETGKDAKQEGKRSGRKVLLGTVPDFTFTGQGVRISEILPDSPAMKAGLQKGDIIFQFDEYEINTLRDYSNALKAQKPGDTITITGIRNNEKITIQAILADR